MFLIISKFIYKFSWGAEEPCNCISESTSGYTSLKIKINAMVTELVENFEHVIYNDYNYFYNALRNDDWAREIINMPYYKIIYRILDIIFC